MYSFLLVVCFLMTTCFLPLQAKVRHVILKQDQIVTVRTALGLATIVQVPSTPTRLVIGNKSAFKVEYLDKAVTIKPLRSLVGTNLYIYTDHHRYNLKLVSAQKHLADYVVYLKPRISLMSGVEHKPRDKLKKDSEKEPDVFKNIRWKKFKTFLNNEEIRLIVNKIGSTKTGIHAIDFSIYSTKDERVDPSWIKIKQNKKTIPIYKLFFDGLTLSFQRSVSGLILLERKNLSTRFPVRMEFHRNRISHLTIKEVGKW